MNLKKKHYKTIRVNTEHINTCFLNKHYNIQGAYELYEETLFYFSPNQKKNKG